MKEKIINKMSDLPDKLKKSGLADKIKANPKKSIIIGCAGLAVIIFAVSGAAKMIKSKNEEGEIETANAERRSISRTVEGSSVLEANDTYNVTALVTGEIISDTFNEGDVVTKDTVLYTIDSSDAQNKLTQAHNSLAKAQNNIRSAGNSYSNLTITSDCTGTISEILVSEGENVGDGTKIAKVENTSRLKIQIPFNESDAGSIRVGDSAKLSLASSNNVLYGTVTNISSSTVATSAHSIVRYVTIEVSNPGALTANEKASAVIGNVACSDLGTFEYSDSGYITAKTSGKLSRIYVEENDYISAGQIVGHITSDSVAISYDNSVLEVENAQIQLNEAQENLDDYVIKAPIDGTIITKNKKAGEKLEQNNSSSEPMAIIYDMSVLKVMLSIDESDIRDIEVGQKVTVTSDAVEGMFEGEVIKVGIDGTSANGVTTYPVEISISEYGDLLPGMNVDCTISVEAAENVLTVPVNALQRGNVVYVKGNKEDDSDTAPEGFKTVEVETGITDSQYIEIKSGINEGDEVYTSMAPSGKEAVGESEDAMGAMGAMGGGMPGGMSGGGMPGGGGGGMRSGGGMPGGGMR